VWGAKGRQAEPAHHLDEVCHDREKKSFQKEPEKALGKASLRVGDSLRSDNPKEQVTLRLDSDVVEHYRESSPGLHRRINDDLRRAAHLPRRDKRV
jgi:uncharacterized protein (DUF4415 family)